MDYMAMGKRIRNSRKRLHMSQAVLSEKVDISVSFLGHIERGSRKPSIDTIVKIGNVLQSGVDKLIVDSLAEGMMLGGFTEADRRLVLDVVELIRNHRNNE